MDCEGVFWILAGLTVFIMIIFHYNTLFLQQINNFKPLKEVELGEQCGIYSYLAKYGIRREYCFKYWQAIRKIEGKCC
jgi:hypothetical protein